MKMVVVAMGIFLGTWAVVGGFAALINELLLGRHSFVVVYLNLGVFFGTIPALLLFLRYRKEARQRMGRPRL